MRTTLTIDDDLLEVLRSMAKAKQESLGVTISRILRGALTVRGSSANAVPMERNGVPLLRYDGEKGSLPVTMEFINRLRDGEFSENE